MTIVRFYKFIPVMRKGVTYGLYAFQMWFAYDQDIISGCKQISDYGYTGIEINGCNIMT